MTRPGIDAPWHVSTRRGFWIARGVGAAAFAAACAYSIRGDEGAVAALGILGLALFGFFTAYALRQLLRRGPRLTLEPGGFDAADLGVGTIAWGEVEGVQVFGSHEAPFVAFHVRDPAAFVARMSPWTRMVVRLLRASGLPMFSVNLIGVDRDPADVLARARALMRASGPETHGTTTGLP